MRTFQKTPETITTIRIDLGKNTFHLVGVEQAGRNRLTMIIPSDPNIRTFELPTPDVRMFGCPPAKIGRTHP